MKKSINSHKKILLDIKDPVRSQRYFSIFLRDSHILVKFYLLFSNFYQVMRVQRRLFKALGMHTCTNRIQKVRIVLTSRDNRCGEATCVRTITVVRAFRVQLDVTKLSKMSMHASDHGPERTVLRSNASVRFCKL